MIQVPKLSNKNNPIARFFIRARSSNFFSIVNITSVVYIIVLGLTFKDFQHLMPSWIKVAQALGVSIIIANLCWLHYSKNVPRAAGIMLFCMFAIHMVNITFAGGIDTPHFAWIFLFPILAGGTLGWRGQIFFYVVCLLGTIFYAVYPENMAVLPYENDMGYTFFVRFMCLTVFSLVMFTYYFTLNEKMEHLKTALQLASFESDLFLGVFNSKAQSVLLIDTNGIIARANAKAHETFGFTDNTLINLPFTEICHAGLDILAPSKSTEGASAYLSQEVKVTTNSGNTIWAEYNRLNIADEYNNTHTLITIEDISARKNHESELSYLARYDHLTKLPNRLSIQEHLNEMIEYSQQRNIAFAVIFFDLDKFKHVNDIQGHQAGDIVLLEVANRLRDYKRKADVVARFGGDEFVLLMDNIQTKNQIIEMVVQLQSAICQAIEDKGNEFFVGSSAGIAMYPEDGDTADALIQKADLAMYKAKSEARGNYQFYCIEHDDSIKRQIKLGSELNYAIERDELTLLFQPIYDIDDHLCAAEALIRWKNNDLGRISPDEFIPICEENGLIVPIGLWVLDEACKTLRQWHDMGFENLVMSVNVSYRQINSHDMVAELRRTLLKYNLPGEALILELTERVFADDLGLVQDNIKQFAKLGVQTAIDDFGVGFSSLSYLKKTDFSSIKIDRSFIKDIEVNASARKLCAAITSMARDLGLTVTAEGVEKEAHLTILKAMKIEKYQGFLMSKPLDSQDFESLLHRP